MANLLAPTGKSSCCAATNFKSADHLSTMEKFGTYLQTKNLKFDMAYKPRSQQAVVTPNMMHSRRIHSETCRSKALFWAIEIFTLRLFAEHRRHCGSLLYEGVIRPIAVSDIKRK